eukprot:2245672-Lingulodinium_polyedra.AAC.1
MRFKGREYPSGPPYRRTGDRSESRCEGSRRPGRHGCNLAGVRDGGDTVNIPAGGPGRQGRRPNR